MPLFQNSVLNKYLKAQDKQAIKTAYQNYTTYFHNPEIQQNILDAKEEQFQEGFLRELFVKILGYTLYPQPDFNLTTEFKNETGAKKADGAILRDGKALAVIELKGTDTTDLDKINTQAFNYKNNQSNCIYVITSNFEKLRFFIHHAVEYMEFNLFTLTEEEFQILWLCLRAESLFNGIPLKAKEESLLVEEKITRQLYQDYSAFKKELWQNMAQNSPETDKLLLFKKTQKLLDRFLFIFFAEDKGLLPPNSISKIVEQWQKLKELDEYRPLYERFKKYFGYLNTGWKGKEYEIFAYNGGLFRPDKVLDEISIDDDVLRPHVMKLTGYDFESEVDVNILGHIFEHSLAEMENITAELEGREVEKSKTRRKKDGVFYTPRYITKYIVDHTLGKLCEEKKLALEISDDVYVGARKRSRKRLQNLQAYRDWLLNLTICDPACGSGAFLNQALEFLINEHRYLDELTAKYHRESLILSDIEDHILEKNLYGVDINEESVEIAKLSLWLRTATKGRKLTSLSHNIKCGNSLIDDQGVAGEKAFNWRREFPDVFAKGGFDVVIGNPPYGASFTDEEKIFIKERYKVSAQGKIDSYKQFFEFGFAITRPNGFLSYITPNTFLYNIQSKRLRELILDKLIIIEGIELRKNIFADAPDVVPAILTVRNKVDHSKYDVKTKVAFPNRNYSDIDSEKFEIDQLLPIRLFREDKERKFNLRFNIGFLSIKNKIGKHPPLGKFFKLRQGTKPYGSKDKKEAVVLSNKKHDANWELAINGRNISRYNIQWDGEYVKRCDELHSCLDLEIVRGSKIYFQRMRKISLFPRIVACYDHSDIHGLYTCSVIYPCENSLGIDLKYLLAIINSLLINLWYKYYDTDIEIKLISVKQIPIPIIDQTLQRRFIEKVDIITIRRADLQSIQCQLTDLLKSKFNIEKLSKKLHFWYELDFKEFLKELKKAKVALGLAEEAEWMNYFNKQKQKAEQLKTEINRIDNEIDQLVYELYGLTEEEIKIVEGNS